MVRTGAGPELTAADHANVTFEVEIDQRSRSGWGVLVRGPAEEVTAGHRDEFVRRTTEAATTPWAPGEHGHRVRLIPQDISGRRIVAGRLPPPFEDAAHP